jgi:putative chitinase
MKKLDYNDLVPHFKYANPSILAGLVKHQDLFEKYEITTNQRRNMLLAQLAHESDGFRTTREYASGSAYEGRSDLGNTEPGDGRRFRGRGLIQLTGRHNYTVYGEKLGLDLVSNPVIVERMPLALEVSLVYWQDRKLNNYADEGDFRQVTRRINGGYNGMASREKYLRVFRNLYSGD